MGPRLVELILLINVITTARNSLTFPVLDPRHSKARNLGHARRFGRPMPEAPPNNPSSRVYVLVDVVGTP